MKAILIRQHGDPKVMRFEEVAIAPPGPGEARIRHTAVPTTASATRHSPSIRNPVAKSQWTCSAGGCILFHVFQQSGPHDEVEQKPDSDHE